MIITVRQSNGNYSAMIWTIDIPDNMTVEEFLKKVKGLSLYKYHPDIGCAYSALKFEPNGYYFLSTGKKKATNLGSIFPKLSPD